MSSGALTTIAAAKINAMAANANSTAPGSIMLVGKGVPARTPRANSIAEVPAVGGGYIPAAVLKSQQKVHGVGHGKKKTRSDPNAAQQHVPIHLFKKEEAVVIDRASVSLVPQFPMASQLQCRIRDCIRIPAHSAWSDPTL